MRDTPIITFMNKLDRDIRDPMELLDEVENVLKSIVRRLLWPIGCGKLFKGFIIYIKMKPIFIKVDKALLFKKYVL